MEKIRINNGIFNFLDKQKCSIHDMRRILSLYGLSIGIKRPNRVKAEWYLIMSNLAQKDFKNFKKLYNITKVKTNHIHSYDDWYDICNLDGTFAYNGVADDF